MSGTTARRVGVGGCVVVVEEPKVAAGLVAAVM